MKKLSL